MDPRLLQYYNLELQHLREMGGEFAQQFPKIAARLGMSGLEVADPYVERLLEGVAFLAARVQLKMDAEFPRFTQALLEIVHPHYLAPTPSMMVTQLTPEPKDPNLKTGRTIPRGSALQAVLGSEDGTSCEFRTAHEVTLWPIQIASASYFTFAPDLSLTSLPIANRIKGGLRIRLEATAGPTFDQMAIDRLCFYLAGRDDVANKLFELCLAAPLGAVVTPPDSPSESLAWLPSSSIRPVGFADDEALLPATVRSFQGYRLLQEYFSFPQRFRFFEMTGLGGALQRWHTEQLELVLLFGRGDPQLENMVDASNVALFCTPAINLFPKRADRVNLNDSVHECHVIPDRTRPMDFEVFEVTAVKGHGSGDEVEQEFLPFYSAYTTADKHDHSGYFTTRREPRLPSSTQKRRGARSSYIGSEVFVSLVDASQAPYRGDLRQLSIQALCTNRDLVLHMPLGVAKSDLSLDVAAPVASIRVVSGPSRPYGPLADGAVAWRAINHLALNYLSLVNTTAQEGATSLRDLLQLYAAGADAGARKQIDGIKSVKVNRVVRRLRGAGPLTFGRGLEIIVSVDELAFEGSNAFLLGAVLDRYFARHVSLNSFTETVLRSETRGDINRWVPQWGTRPTL
jgi:type VI secretion system protein ImpG